MTNAERARLRRERLGPDVVRAENNEAARRSRALKRAQREAREQRDAADAALLRSFFGACTNAGQRLIAFSGSNGKVQSQVLEAAWRLAGGSLR
jgi:hypothetical protein